MILDGLPSQLEISHPGGRGHPGGERASRGEEGITVYMWGSRWWLLQLSSSECIKSLIYLLIALTRRELPGRPESRYFAPGVNRHCYACRCSRSSFSVTVSAFCGWGLCLAINKKVAHEIIVSLSVFWRKSIQLQFVLLFSVRQALELQTGSGNLPSSNSLGAPDRLRGAVETHVIRAQHPDTPSVGQRFNGGDFLRTSGGNSTEATQWIVLKN